MDGLLTIDQAGRAIDAAALGLLGLALFGILVQRLESAILLLALQGVFLSIAAGAVALSEMDWRPAAACLLAIAVKVVAIPFILMQVLRHVARSPDVESVVPQKLAFPLAIGLVLGAYWLADPFRDASLGFGFHAANALPAALGLLLLGIFSMATRKRALTQVIGLVTMENGIYLAAVAISPGLPFAVELGVALDVLTGVALLALVTHEINRIFSSIDIDRLRSLRG